MNQYYGSPDPPRTLAERLSRLNDNLQALGERLKASVAGLLSDTIADAVRDSVRGLLGENESPPTPRREYRENRDPRDPASYRDGEDDPWGDEDRRWRGEEVYTPARETSPEGNRWRNAASASLQTCLWFLKRQPRRRPVLTTVCVTLAAGVTGFVGSVERGERNVATLNLRKIAQALRVPLQVLLSDLVDQVPGDGDAGR